MRPYLVFIIALFLAPFGWGQAINLAKFQQTTASSEGSPSTAREATDGIVSNQSRWFSSGPGPHWLEVTLAEAYPVGSAHLYCGFEDISPIASFSLEYHNGTTWVAIRSFTGNTANDLNIVFPSTVTATRFRIYSTEALIRVKEFALFPPNGPAGYPLGTDVNLNLASQRAPLASSIYTDTSTTPNTAFLPQYAVDGYVDDNSRWLSDSSSGPHTLELELVEVQKVGSFHLYSGVGTSNRLTAFSLEYRSGSSWLPAPLSSVSTGTVNGNAVSGANAASVSISLTTPVFTDRVRITFTQPFGRIREFLVLPANTTHTGTPGYPLGAGVKVAPRPTTTFTTYHDDWHRIALRGFHPSLVVDATSARLNAPGDSEAEESYQLLYSYALSAFRIINKANDLCLQVAGASQSAGAAIEEGVYHAAPHQLWTLVPVDSGYFQIRNVWSGMVLTSSAMSGTAAVVTQQSLATSSVPNTKQWKPLFASTPFRKGTGGWLGSFNAQWGYNWGRDGSLSGLNKFFAPMQWGNYNWDTLHSYFPRWHDDAKPLFFLGFNEPDRTDQSNLPTSTALDLWPRVEAMQVPLLSPACSLGGENTWLDPFMNSLDARGYRCDYVGGHWYAFPNINNIFAFFDELSTIGHGRDVWLTEFSVVDWSGGSGSFSEEDTYNFLIEFLWRAEDQANLRKYAVFIFSGTVPTNPWDKTNPRSNFRDDSGNLHAYGKAYSAWDGDRTLRTAQPYLIHNRAGVHRLRNAATTTPAASWIRREDSSTQWALQVAGAGKYWITSLADGQRLRYSGGVLDFAAPGTTGTAVEWTIAARQYCWHTIRHTATGQYLRLRRDNNAAGAPTLLSVETVASNSGTTTTDWALVKPYAPVAVDPAPAPGGFTAHAASGAVYLSWNASTAVDHLHYNLYRRTAGATSWTLLATGLDTESYRDGTVVNGTVYEYAVADFDFTALESPLTAIATAAPRVLDTFTAITYVDATRSNLALAAGGTWNPPINGSPGADNQWRERTGFANNGNIWEAGGEVAENAPRLTMTVTGLQAHRVYEVFAYFWASDGVNWRLRAGKVTDSQLASFIGHDSAGTTDLHADPLRFGAPVTPFTNPSLGLGVTTAGFHFGNHFTNPNESILLAEASRTLYQAPLGWIASDASGRLAVAIDDLPATGSSTRTWFDGIGYRLTTTGPEFSVVSTARSQSQVTLEWESYGNLTYSIIASRAVTLPYDIVIATNIPAATGLRTRYTFTLPPALVGDPNLFFKVVASP